MGSFTGWGPAVFLFVVSVISASCGPPPARAGSATLRSAEPKNAPTPLLPDDAERPFAPSGGVVLVGPNGSLVAIRLWEGDVTPTCSSTNDASARAAGATLSVALPTAVGAGVLDERGAVLFDSRSQDRRVAKVRARVPAKIAGGTSTRVHFDVRDDGGAKLFDGEIEVLVCVST